MSSQPLRSARTLGETILKVDHAGEHGAVGIYQAQSWIARWRAPAMVGQIEHFRNHERRHRALFAAELERRGIRRCRSYHLCGTGGLFLGLVTGLMGKRAIDLTTEAVESVVLSHLQHQLAALARSDPSAAAVVRQIVEEEQEHHDTSTRRLEGARLFDRLLRPIIRGGTELVIWMGMRRSPG